jgi:steroid delta-isomerase-like uncharacterized protein
MKPVRKIAFLLLAMLIIPVKSNAQEMNNNSETKTMEAKMSVTRGNKEVIQRLYEEALNKRNMELLKDFISADFEGINGAKGAAAFEVPVHAVIKAVPDAHWNLEELFGEGNKVFVRWKLSGTHTGPFQSFAATGNRISNDGMAIFEFKDGKVEKAHVYTDRLGFLQQLDVLPTDLALVSNDKPNKNLVHLVDKFLVPLAAKKEFYERMNTNRNFIKTLPGFIEDTVYESTDEAGNLICVTIAVWETEVALKKAKEVVQAEYKKQDLTMADVLERLNITMDRGTYKRRND